MKANELSKEKDEIERLLSAIADGEILGEDVADGQTRSDLIERLQTLLRDRPELQQHYFCVAGMHTLLTYEFRLSAPHFAPLLEHPLSTEEFPLQCQLREERQLHGGGGCTPPPAIMRRHSWWIPSAIAISLALVLVGRTFFPSHAIEELPKSDPQSVSQVPAQPPSIAASQTSERLVIRDQQSLRLLSKITKTSLLSSFELPVQHHAALESSPLKSTLGTGTVWMQSFSGVRERGHIVALPPQCTLDLYVDADSCGHNTLSVVEIGENGEATGEAVSFNNRPDTLVDQSASQIGCIGSWSKFNGTDETKYYFFTGSHILPQQTADDSWHLSDYSVFLETSDLLYIGWDDSGYRLEKADDTLSYKPDRDFDDICATIRILPPAAQLSRNTGTVIFTPRPSSGAPAIGDSETGYRVSVASGEKIVLRVTAESSLPNAISIVDAKTRRVLWRQVRISGHAVTNPRAERGAYLIENNSPEVQNYLLIAHHSTIAPSSNDGSVEHVPWKPTLYKVLEKEEDSLTVGFDDSKSDHDWNDIQIHARWFTD